MTEIAAKHHQGAGQEASIVAALGARSIVLVGMMGAGKSTIGRRLASRLHIPFLDADHEIEAAHAGMTVAEIFAAHGEPYFRDGEARVIARLLDGGPGVLATGGGAFMREETRSRIRDKGVSVWLDVEGDVILRRIKRRADRPLLQTADPAATIEKLSDAQLADKMTVDTPTGPQTVLRARYLILLVTDLAEHYAQLAGYMRILALVPPSALRPPPR